MLSDTVTSMTQHNGNTSTETFDFVITGAGSAGSVLAARLSQDPAVRVLLLEAGPADDAPGIAIPALAASLWGTDVDWGYELDQQDPHYEGARLYPRGKTLGGSSSINIMIYTRGNRADFDDWAVQGGPGWDYNSVLPYFIRAEHNSRLAGPLHGTAGPLHVEDRQFTHPLAAAWVDAAVAWGLPRSDDFNGASQTGAGEYQVTCHGGRRWSTADAYLRPVLHRPNLTIRTGAHVTRILFDGTRAVGVEYLRDGAAEIARAESEVLLSGGSINSPQLLMLSGVGPADQLRSHGISVLADLSGVGRNLHDHTFTPLVWETLGTLDLLEMATPENMAAWQRDGSGPFASNAGETGGFLSTQGGSLPDIQFIIGPTAFVNHGRTQLPMPNITTVVSPTRPASRGQVTLRSADPFAPARINPGYFTDPADRATAITGLRAALEIASQGPLARHIRGLRLPTGTTLDSTGLADHARHQSQTSYHPVGTCAMGTHDQAVVDPELRVHGIEGLRVVDASVMPVITRGNTNAPTIMIAEKAADLIKG
jgi:choline dehydrogenase